MTTDIKHLNYWDYKNELFDKFGNRKKAYEIVRYEKYSDGKWHEDKRYNTLCDSTYVINNKIYFECNDSLIPMNMDFDSDTCHACEQIVKEIPVTHRITANEILFTCHNPLDYLEFRSLYRQSYSDIPCFYTLQDQNGNWSVDYGSHDLTEIRDQIVRDIEINSTYKDYGSTTVRERLDKVKEWFNNILDSLNGVIEKVA